VITSTESSLPEAAGEAGLCLPPNDIPAWTAALSRAIHDATWRRDRGERGQVHAAQFSWARTADQTVASYRKVLSG
jgi:glycosyltransferase involved in cell wall biosynthesis